MILVGGENLIDFIQVKNGTSPMTYQANAGGSPFNVAKALGRQGVQAGFLTPISTDTLGDLLADDLAAAGVSLLAPRHVAPTSLAVVSLRASIPSYQFYRDNTAERQVSAQMLIDSTPPQARALCIGSLALTSGADADAWAAYYAAQHARGIFCALDPNIRAAFIQDRAAYLARLDKVLACTDLLKLSDEDLAWLIPDTEPLAAARLLLAQSSAKLLVVTLGEKGAFALAGDLYISVGPAPVSGLRDTVGAGDTFTATLLARLESAGDLSAAALAGLAEKDLENLLGWAANAAALNCEQDGCAPPSLARLQARMAS